VFFSVVSWSQEREGTVEIVNSFWLQFWVTAPRWRGPSPSVLVPYQECNLCLSRCLFALRLCQVGVYRCWLETPPCATLALSDRVLALSGWCLHWWVGGACCQVVVWPCQVVFWPCRVVFWLCQDGVYCKRLETPPCATFSVQEARRRVTNWKQACEKIALRTMKWRAFNSQLGKRGTFASESVRCRKAFCYEKEQVPLLWSTWRLSMNQFQSNYKEEINQQLKMNKERAPALLPDNCHRILKWGGCQVSRMVDHTTSEQIKIKFWNFIFPTN